MQFDTLSTFLQWLTVSGGGGMALAYFLERQTSFGKLPSKVKFWTVLLICLLVPVGADFAQGQTDPNSLFLAAQAGVLAFAASQWAHNGEKTYHTMN